MNVRYRAASVGDVSVIAPMNAQLIRDEGHRNAMTVPQLAERLTAWLKAEYQACLFELESKAIGYALYRVEPEYIYLRQLFVQPEMRRLGVVRGNTRAERYWESLGYVQTRTREGVQMGKLTNTVRVMVKPLAGGTIEEFLSLVPRDRPEVPSAL